jgi:hypothetical protein
MQQSEVLGVKGTTTIQTRLRCKRASMSPDPLDVDPIIDENLAFINPALHKTP